MQPHQTRQSGSVSKARGLTTLRRAAVWPSLNKGQMGCWLMRSLGPKEGAGDGAGGLSLTVFFKSCYNMYVLFFLEKFLVLKF